MVLVEFGRLSQPGNGGDGFVEGMGPLVLWRMMRVAADFFADTLEVVLDILWWGIGSLVSFAFTPRNGGGEGVPHHARLTEPVTLRWILLVQIQAAKMKGIFTGIAAE